MKGVKYKSSHSDLKIFTDMYVEMLQNKIEKNEKNVTFGMLMVQMESKSF